MGTVSLVVGDPAQLQVQVALGDFWSALALFAEVGADLDRGLPERIRRHLGSALTPAERAAMVPVAHPEEGLFPDCLLPNPSSHPLSFADVLEMFADYPADQVVDSIRREHPRPDTSPVWRPILRRPSQWVRNYGSGLHSVSRAFGDRWAPMHARLSRESERIGAAAVGGSVDGLLATLSPRMQFDGTTLRFDHAVPGAYQLAGRRLILTPMVAGAHMLMSVVDHPDYVWIAYPVTQAAQRTPRRHGDGLVLVLGDVRAAVLRALDVPRSMSDLADLVLVAPNTLSFHCRRLEDADLVARRRSGKRIWCVRTPRGTELIDLLGRL